MLKPIIDARIQANTALIEPQPEGYETAESFAEQCGVTLEKAQEELGLMVKSGEAETRTFVASVSKLGRTVQKTVYRAKSAKAETKK